MRKSAVVLVALPVWVACMISDASQVGTGDTVPPFRALTLAGDEFHSAELAGAPYMLNIWATWCAPCRHEMPELQELHNIYADRGFQVVGVSVDDRGASETIRRFLAETGVHFPIYHDPSWEIMDSYGLLGLPGTFLVGADGRLVRRWVGWFSPMADDVQESVAEVLAAASDRR